MLTHNRRWAQNLYRTSSWQPIPVRTAPRGVPTPFPGTDASATGQPSQVSRQKLLRREFVGRGGPEPAPCLQFGRRKLGLVGRVGEMLRLQAEARATRILHASLTRYRAVQKIAGVKLHSRLRGPHF